MKIFLVIFFPIFISVTLWAQPTPDTVWTRTYGGIYIDECSYAQQTADGGYIFAGFANYFDAGGDAWLIKTDQNGDSIWSRTFTGNDDEFFTTVQPISNGYILAGSTESFGAGGNDFWLVKIDANGDSLWSRTFGGGGDDGCTSG